ncbi:DNA gyrase inhibitor YacG [Aurantiacibacter aquimixticola]|uniref:DNA gyrase inhibitor YacG n=1 Tax=Aurantiacibacter aquimixticola TaxID=1958945 RepID=A0A419RQX1_9SPHN|nr:DNA gyrase inhibitor YacG [Aurantiacibacter aquimixticola]RJY08165.1 DNA gyrase inhibitor YacG [Aurantiacibacter aquimixticola]
MTSRPCPICKKPRMAEFTPFCSQRCRDRDLAQWFNDGYAVPGLAASPEDVARED